MVVRTTEDPATAPNPTHSTSEAVAPIGGHGRLDHFQRLEKKGSASCLGSATSVERETYLSQRGDLEHVQASAEQQIAELDGLLLELRRGGHLSSGRHLVYGDALKGALTKGCWGLRRLLRDRGRMWRGEGGSSSCENSKRV
jgi:hypothetical protein